MKPNEYEQLVATIARSVTLMVDGVLPGPITCGRDSHLNGASGYSHQIDVAVRGAADWLLIECKYWTDPVTPDSLLTFAARVIDIQAEAPRTKLFPTLVTKNPPGPGATVLARYFGIDLMLVTSEQDYALRYKDRLFKAVPGFGLLTGLGTVDVVVEDEAGRRALGTN
jgi:hypothetical protein